MGFDGLRFFINHNLHVHNIGRNGGFENAFIFENLNQTLHYFRLVLEPYGIC